MIIKKFVVNPYKWKVIFVKFPKKKDAKKVEKLLKPFDLKPEDVKEILNDVKGITGSNGAHHIFNNRIMMSMLILYKQKSQIRHIVSLCHEKRHLEDRILNYCNVDDDEAAAYLAGYLAKKLF